MSNGKLALAKAQLEMKKRRTEIEIREAPNYIKWIDAEVYIEDPHKTGATQIKFKPWDAQVDYFRIIDSRRQTITLKARQLGISWCTIIYCLWLAIFHAGVTIMVFSKDMDAAIEIIRRARYIFHRLSNKPTQEKGRGDNQKEIKFANGSRFKAFPASKNAGSSFTATFIILDEADKMEFGSELYTSIKPTVDDGGRIAIIFTAFGSTGLGRNLWKNKAGEESDGAGMVRFFIPWYARPGRTREWYSKTASEAISLAYHKQEYPSTPDEALEFTDLELRYIQNEDAFKTQSTPEPMSAFLPCVLSLDAGVNSDNFAMVSTVWHPVLKLPCVRDSQVWEPNKTATGQLDLNEIYDNIRKYVRGHRIRRIVYDPYQMVAIGQELQKLADAREFSQNSERLAADTTLRKRIERGEFLHNGDAQLIEHFLNANTKVDSTQTKLRMVKRSEAQKIDLAVAASMAVYELVEQFPLTDPSGIMVQGNRQQNNFAGKMVRPFDGRPRLIYDRIRREGR